MRVIILLLISFVNLARCADLPAFSSAKDWQANPHPEGITEPVRADDSEGTASLAFGAQFTTDTLEENRACWDWTGFLDLSQVEGIDFEAIADDTDEGQILKKVAIYFGTADGGWYVKCFGEIPSSWTDQGLLLSSFATEGNPKDWSAITKIRVSTWSATPGRAILRLRNVRISGKTL